MITPRVLLALMFVAACSNEPASNDRNAPSGTRPDDISSSRLAPSERQVPPAAGPAVQQADPAAATPVSGTPNATDRPPPAPWGSPDPANSGGPSAAGRTDNAPADASRVPVQADHEPAAPASH